MARRGTTLAMLKSFWRAAAAQQRRTISELLLGLARLRLLTLVRVLVRPRALCLFRLSPRVALRLPRLLSSSRSPHRGPVRRPCTRVPRCWLKRFVRRLGPADGNAGWFGRKGRVRTLETIRTQRGARGRAVAAPIGRGRPRARPQKAAYPASRASQPIRIVLVLLCHEQL
mgnify:CR=1 FL=1